MKTPDPKEELLQQLATSLLRDVFAAAVIGGINTQSGDRISPDAETVYAYEVADLMLRVSHTPALIEQISKLKS